MRITVVEKHCSRRTSLDWWVEHFQLYENKQNLLQDLIYPKMKHTQAARAATIIILNQLWNRDIMIREVIQPVWISLFSKKI